MLDKINEACQRRRELLFFGYNGDLYQNSQCRNKTAIDKNPEQNEWFQLGKGGKKFHHVYLSTPEEFVSMFDMGSPVRTKYDVIVVNDEKESQLAKRILKPHGTILVNEKISRNV